MSTTTLPIDTRWWSEQGRTAYVDSDGFLLSPVAPGAFAFNPNARSLSNLEDFPCLVLLGDAGLGKSTELRKQYQNQSEQENARVVFHDLGEYGSEDRLDRAVVPPSMPIEANQMVKNRTWILDSLDEAITGIPKTASIIKHKLRSHVAEGLKLRIACRTTAWPESLTAFLREQFGNDGVMILELLPFTRGDVARSASNRDINPEEFIEAVCTHNVGPLASSPSTLRFLLDRYARDGAFPDGLADLYEKGLEILCEASNERRERNATPEITSLQKLAVAARLAACLTLTGRKCLFNGPTAERQDGDVSVAELVGGQEGIGNSRIEVTQRVVDAVLRDTGLFTGRGSLRYGFSHKTFEEFLAARYLRDVLDGHAQLHSLLFADDRHVIPQLHEVAAWLACMNDNLLNTILETDPEVLLLSDVASRNDAVKERLIEQILSRAKSREVTRDVVFGSGRQFARLIHPQLANQLRPYLCDSAVRIEARLVAVQIAGACVVSALGADLAELSLDCSVNHMLRVYAARAVVDINSPESNRLLKPLALGLAGDDPDDQLRGVSLSATWPDVLSPDELWDALAPPKMSGFGGAYQRFLYEAEIADELEVKDLPAALKWVAKLRPSHGLSDARARIGNEILLYAWRELEHSSVLDSLAQVALLRILRHEALFYVDKATSRTELPKTSVEAARELIRFDVTRRHRLLERVVEEIGSETRIIAMGFGETPLAFPEDFDWLIARAESSTGSRAAIWAELAKYAYSHDDPSHLELWLSSRQRSSVVARILDWPLSVTLKTPAARKMRRNHFKRMRMQKQCLRRKSLTPLPPERVRIMVDRCLTADPRWFARLILEMTLKPDDSCYSSLTKLVETPGWDAANDGGRHKIIEAARVFLKEAVLDVSMATKGGMFSEMEMAPGLAFQLLMSHDRAFLTSLPSERYEELVPFLLAHAPADFHSDCESKRALSHFALEKAPDATCRTVATLLSQEETRGSFGFVLQLLDMHSNPQLCAEMLKCLGSMEHSQQTFATCLRWLLERSADGSRDFAESFIVAPPPNDNPARARSIDAAAALISIAADAAWTRVWEAMNQDSTWGCAVFSRLIDAYDQKSQDWTSRLSELDLSDLICFLYLNIPGFSGHTPGDYVRHWRDQLLRNFVASGSDVACATIEKLCQTHPKVEWFVELRIRARAARRRLAWSPPTPDQLLALSRNADRRYVQSEVQLLDLIVESLIRLSQRLHGITPAVFDLWNDLGSAQLRPKDETHLSDYIKRHLETDLNRIGLVVNREVQIRRSVPGAKATGQDTDIIVEAPLIHEPGNSKDVLRVIIEVKGCWHPEVKTAMASQLVERYLLQNECQHGIYVVGWFHGVHWDDSDYRKKTRPWGSLSAAREFLDNQATELTRDRVGIGGEVRAF